MEVKLISITQSKIEKDGLPLSPEQLLVYCARVSNPGNQMNTETADKLLGYCIKNHHWSVFEQADMCVEIKTSRAIAQQILRHRSFSFQEFSQRYAEVTDFEPVQLRKQAEKNRQSSAEAFDPEINWSLNSYDASGVASKMIEGHIEESEMLYKELIKAGVAKECARMVLPLTVQTTLYAKGSLRSWLTYLNIRLEMHTQLEHRQIAVEIAKLVGEQFPNITKSLNNFNNFEGGFI